MILRDFQCTMCKHVQEELLNDGDEFPKCVKCGGKTARIFTACAKTLVTIIPAYPGCKRVKAGYIHTHGDQPATKVQSGYGGCGNPG